MVLLNRSATIVYALCLIPFDILKVGLRRVRHTRMLSKELDVHNHSCGFPSAKSLVYVLSERPQKVSRAAHRISSDVYDMYASKVTRNNG